MHGTSRRVNIEIKRRTDTWDMKQSSEIFIRLIHTKLARSEFILTKRSRVQTTKSKTVIKTRVKFEKNVFNSIQIQRQVTLKFYYEVKIEENLSRLWKSKSLT